MDRETAGISATKLNKLGWRASDTGEIGFIDVRIPAENLMGEEAILYHATLCTERLIMAINAARAEFALEYTVGYMKDRTAFGKSLDKFQALRVTS
jgi:alkylation response protein AidB-like acyl-CoA dehydrogenase